jgi:hypothetical protein
VLQVYANNRKVKAEGKKGKREWGVERQGDKGRGRQGDEEFKSGG